MTVDLSKVKVGDSVEIDGSGLTPKGVYEVIEVDPERELDCSIKVDWGGGWWARDNTVVSVVTEPSGRREISFTDIVQMIADDAVPEDAVFLTPAIYADAGAALLEVHAVDNELQWASGTPVRLSKETVADKWLIEIPEKRKELTWIEAMTAIKDGETVEAVNRGDSFILSGYMDFDDLWDDSPLADLDDLLNRTTFYKVAD